MEVEERTVHPIIEACLGRLAATGADEEHDNVRHALSKLFELFEDDEPFAGAVAALTSEEERVKSELAVEGLGGSY